MFRLEDEIKRWRSEYEGDIAFSEEDILELETHLRQAFDKQVEDGLSEPEAFAAAVAMLGERKALRKEYNNAKPMLWVVFSSLRVLYLVVGLIAFGVAQVYKYKTGYPPSFLYSTNVMNGFDAFTWIAWWLPVLTIMSAFLLIKNSAIKMSTILAATLLITGYVSAPYLITSFIYDAQSIFRTTFLILIASLFFKEMWAWRVTILVTGIYLVLVSIPMLPSLSGLIGLPLQSTLIVLVTTIGDPIIGVLLGYALFRQGQQPVLKTRFAF